MYGPVQLALGVFEGLTLFISEIRQALLIVTKYLQLLSKVQRIEEDLTSAIAKKKQVEKSALDLEETVRSRDTEISFLKNKLHDVEQSFASLREKEKDLAQECIVVKSKYSKLEAYYENVHEQKVM